MHTHTQTAPSPSAHTLAPSLSRSLSSTLLELSLSLTQIGWRKIGSLEKKSKNTKKTKPQQAHHGYGRSPES